MFKKCFWLVLFGFKFCSYCVKKVKKKIAIFLIFKNIRITLITFSTLSLDSTLTYTEKPVCLQFPFGKEDLKVPHFKFRSFVSYLSVKLVYKQKRKYKLLKSNPMLNK